MNQHKAQRDVPFEDISLGDSVSFERSFSEEDVSNFARLSGDVNPLHTDEEYAHTTVFKKRVVHGMLIGCLCSFLVGMHLPGKKCLYLGQTLHFKKPVFIGDTVTVRGTVTTKSLSARILKISVSVTKGDVAVMEGIATVQVLP